MALSEHGDDHDEDPAYDFDAFRLAVTQGLHPDGRPLNEDMPRWQTTEDDLRDLAEFLQSYTDP